MKIAVLAASVVLLISSLSWISDAAKNETMMVTDGMGRDLEVPSDPDRIVCVNAAAAEAICALGGADRIVAVTSACRMPPVLLDKEILGSSALTLEAEPIIALRPDLVIEGVPPLKDVVRRQLEEAGIPVLQYWALHVDRVLPMIDDLGAILGREERAAALRSFIEGYYDLVKDRLRDLPPESRPRVYYMIMSQICWTCGQGSDMGKSIEEAGGQNIAASLSGTVPEVDPEWIIEQDPDVMVYHDIQQSETAISPSAQRLKECRDLIISQPGFDRIKAVREGRIYIIDSGIVTGPRQIVGFLYLAKWFHPQLFQDVDPEAVHEEMLSSFYDVNEKGCWAYPCG